MTILKRWIRERGLNTTLRRCMFTSYNHAHEIMNNMIISVYKLTPALPYIGSTITFYISILYKTRICFLLTWYFYSNVIHGVHGLVRNLNKREQWWLDKEHGFPMLRQIKKKVNRSVLAVHRPFSFSKIPGFCVCMRTKQPDFHRRFRNEFCSLNSSMLYVNCKKHIHVNVRY